MDPYSRPQEYPPMSYNSVSSHSINMNKVIHDDRPISRTPSPTPSETVELKSGPVDWGTLAHLHFWIRKEWIMYYILLAIIITISALTTIYHKEIVHWLEPAANWMHKLRFGFLVPICILFVVSFPPLFGHEIIAVLCGLVWGLWIGFAIVVAGSFLGEVGNFYAFKYCCRARAEKAERTSFFYAELAQVVREGGFKIALIARLSAIPGHFTTAIFATCGMGIITFSIAALLSSPKQFVTVYLGVILNQTGPTNSKSRIISDSIVAISILVTMVALWYILHEMNKVKPGVVRARRKARQGKLGRANNAPYSHPEAADSESSVSFNPEGSESELPLNTPYQRWSKDGRAIGYAGDPRLYAPQPQRPSGLGPSRGGEEFHDQPYQPAQGNAASAYPIGGGPAQSRNQARQDSDTVGWDMQPPPPPVSNQYPDQTIYATPSGAPPGQSSSSYSYSPTPQAHSNTALHQVEVSSTPNEEQYVTVAYESGPGPLTSAPLPTPTYPSPFDDSHTIPSKGYHSQAPTEDSFYTHGPEASYETAHSRLGTEKSEKRAYSPNPPTYDSDV